MNDRIVTVTIAIEESRLSDLYSFLITPYGGNITSNRLIHYRATHGLTQKDMAERLGVSQRTIGNWESLGIPENPRIRGKLASVLGIDSSRLGASSVRSEPHDGNITFEHLIQYRADNDLTQQDVAERLGVSLHTVNS